MLPPILAEAPFPRGKTASDGLITATATYREEIEGQAFWHPDTVHSTKIPVLLLCVRNATGAAITVARKFCEFKTSVAKVMVSQIGTFPCDTAGAVALPLDDAMTVGATIAANDLFYVVLRGWCSVLTAAAVTNLAAAGTVASDALGTIPNQAGATAAQFVIGKLDYAASYTAATATRIWVDPANLCLPPAAG